MNRVVPGCRVHDVRIVRIEFDQTDAAHRIARADCAVRIRGNDRIERGHPDQRPRLPAIARAIQADPRLWITGDLTLAASDGRHAENGARGRDVDRLRVAWLDGDRADAARRGEIDG